MSNTHTNQDWLRNYFVGIVDKLILHWRTDPMDILCKFVRHQEMNNRMDKQYIRWLQVKKRLFQVGISDRFHQQLRIVQQRTEHKRFVES